MFGVDFLDKYPWRKNESGNQLFRSPILEHLWPHGFSELGAVTFQSAAYVARYVMKKITGDLAASHYSYVTEDGEILQRTPEYAQMSRGGRTGQGIAALWFEKYHRDVYPADMVVSQGREAKPPRYYDNRLKIRDPELFEKLKKARVDAMDRKDNTPGRLAVKEVVQEARIKSLKRVI